MTKHRTKILYPTDFSELSKQALPWVKRMAKALNASVHCLYVVHDPKIYTYDAGWGTMVQLPPVEERVEAVKKQMDQFIADNMGETDGAESEVAVGVPFVEILRRAEELDAAMIMMTTHGHTGLSHVFFGSTTEAVLRKAKCPVMSIRSEDLGTA
jgi:nucleotide-binding universal stress UspA family protein